ncbi:hypothetical protein SAMN06272789_3317 [Streptomyces sp. 1331.2]|nr:hypothetical protein SAMN06272789_3317 [Streptomyces sp. 1331.2]
MIELIARILTRLRLFLAPGNGRRAKPSAWSPVRRRTLTLISPSPKPKPEPIRPVLVGQRRAPWDRDECTPQRPANTLPLCSGIRQPIPPHVVARTLMPKWEPVRPHVIAYTRQAADEAARQRNRRAAAFATALDLPDPLHWLDTVTSGVPHTLAGAVA